MTTVILTVMITLLLRIWNIPVIRDRVFGWVGKLPRALQWVAPIVLAMLAATGQGWIEGVRGEALLLMALVNGGEIGAMAIGLWHTAKRLNFSEVSKMVKSLEPPKPDQPPAPALEQKPDDT
jgi:hypothetical protein